MNVVKIMGGLGNQLFGYAFAKHLESKGSEVGLDLSWFNSPDNHLDRFPVREFLLDHFTTDFKIVDPAQMKLSFVSEGSYNPMTTYDGGYFWGYWQKGSYSKDLNLDIRLKDEYIPSHIRELAEDLGRRDNSVAVHVRGTDYKQFDNWLLGADYYERAIKTMKERVELPMFYIFTDDMAYAWDMVTWIPTNKKFIYDNTELEDFYLMQHCKHNIIANSTYSFWAANLNKHPDKIVVYPEEWKCIENPVDFEGWVKA